MDTRKKRKVSQRNVAKDSKAHDSNGKRNASEETKEKLLLPNYFDKDRIKGKVVLVVNEDFQRPTLLRTGAKKDLDNLKYVFVDKLGFEQLNVGNDFNLNKAELENVLAKWAKIDYNDTDIFVFAISTHGEERPRHTEQYEHALMCSDDMYVFSTDIITKFGNNPSLAGKPKIFFIQACRIPYGTNATTDANIYDPGHDFKSLINPANEESVTKDNEKAHATQDKVDAGHSSENTQISQSLSQYTPVVAGHSSENAQISQSLSQDTAVVAGHSSENAQTSQSQDKAVAGHSIANVGKSQQGSKSIRFPCYKPCPKDSLVVYAIQSGLYAWRSDVDGSWMFHYLHEVIRNYNKSSFVDFFDVLTKTAFLMAKKESDTGEKLSHCKKAVPVIQHRLTKYLCIPLKKHI